MKMTKDNFNPIGINLFIKVIPEEKKSKIEMINDDYSNAMSEMGQLFKGRVLGAGSDTIAIKEGDVVVFSPLSTLYLEEISNHNEDYIILPETEVIGYIKE